MRGGHTGRMGPAATAAAALLTTALTPAGDAMTPAGDELTWSPSPGGFVSGPVTYLETIPLEAGTGSDAVLHDDHLYVTTWRSFSIYDVSDPLEPVRRSTVHLAGAAINEAPQTNGEILLISRDVQALPRTGTQTDGKAGGVLEIYDVTDPADPTLTATWQNERTGFMEAGTVRDHIWACVLDCSYAYSASGTILDLRDPTAPEKVADWSEIAPYRDGRLHHVGEVAPGIVLTGSLPMHVLDARQDPTAPTLLATFEPNTDEPALQVGPTTAPNPAANPETLPARADWPGALQGRIAVVSMETPFTGPCSERSGSLQTFLTPGWRSSGTFQAADSFRLEANGTYTDGAPPYNALGCSSYGMQVHPDFGQGGGRVASAFFEHGVRILDVDAKGRITEAGGFLPAAGNSAAPIWVTDTILYVVDVHRGVDILQVGR
jgi:hypothetical protein